MCVDIVRSSAVFNSLIDYSDALDALKQPGGSVKIVRTKDRVTNPLPSGYRDVLLNVTVEGCDLVMELQLHLKEIIAVKEEAHRIYDFLRTLGWELDHKEAELDLSQGIRQGDHVRIVKNNSTILNDLAVVKDPYWSVTHIKVELIEGHDKGKTKSYEPSDLKIVTSHGAGVEHNTGAAALKPLEISLTGELKSTRKLASVVPESPGQPDRVSAWVRERGEAQEMNPDSGGGGPGRGGP